MFCLQGWKLQHLPVYVCVCVCVCVYVCVCVIEIFPMSYKALNSENSTLHKHLLLLMSPIFMYNYFMTQ